MLTYICVESNILCVCLIFVITSCSENQIRPLRLVWSAPAVVADEGTSWNVWPPFLQYFKEDEFLFADFLSNNNTTVTNTKVVINSNPKTFTTRVCWPRLLVGTCSSAGLLDKLDDDDDDCFCLMIFFSFFIINIIYFNMRSCRKRKQYITKHLHRINYLKKSIKHINCIYII